jgi:hypothetical protein
MTTMHASWVNWAAADRPTTSATMTVTFLKWRTHEVVDQDPQTQPACSNDQSPYFHAVVSGKPRCFRIITLAESGSAAAHANCQKTRVPVPWNNTPYYVTRVPSTLIKDHNDIFQDGTVEMINALVSKLEILEASPTITAPAPSASRPLSKTGTP